MFQISLISSQIVYILAIVGINIFINKTKIFILSEEITENILNLFKNLNNTYIIILSIIVIYEGIIKFVFKEKEKSYVKKS